MSNDMPADVWSQGGPKRKALPLAILFALAVVTSAIGYLSYRFTTVSGQNQIIEELVTGQDKNVGRESPSELLMARAYFLLQKERNDEAGDLLDNIASRGDIKNRAALLYNLGNAKLKLAMSLIETFDIERAVPVVELAKDFYRQTLTLDPNFWGAKYNLEVAMLLVRDLPQYEGSEDDTATTGKKMWTEVPGFPTGLP